jgi:hypothetical protein
MNRFTQSAISLLANLFNRNPKNRVHLSSSPVNESNVSQGIDWNSVYRDRYAYQRQTVLDEALLAWRLNPMARRLLNLQKMYVTDGIEFDCEDEQTKTFLRDFWEHPLNRIGSHLGEWTDELALTGNLFVAITTDRAGMSYLRIYPTDQIADIETEPNDVQQETAYLPKATTADPDPVHILNYWAYRQRKPKTVMLHYAVNRLAGMKWGEPDIAPLLPWLARYASWLEDRVRLNRFRQAFLYVVTGKFNSEADKTARQKQLNASPPSPGSILVTDESELWSVIEPKLNSADANNDGLTLKKFIASGMGYPLHWMSEPESSTRTTAEAAGTPTFKTMEERQKMFLMMLKDILQVVVARNAAIPANGKTPIVVRAADISERDNAALALASNQVITAFGQLVAGGFITADEYLRIVYRFAGETLPSDRPDAPGARGGVKPPSSPSDASASDAKKKVKIDSETGDVKIPEVAK